MAVDPRLLEDLYGGGPGTTPVASAVQQPVQPQPEPEKPTSFIDKIVDVGKGLISGVPKEAENVVQAGHDIVNFVDDKVLGDRYINNDTDVDYVPDWLKPQTGAGKTAQALSAFATGWLTAGRWVSSGVKGIQTVAKLAEVAPKSAQFVNAAVSGGVVDFISGDASDSRLADTLLENDVMNNAVVRYLTTDENDSAAEARFKNVLEGFMAGTALDAVGYVFKAIKGGVAQSLKGSIDGSMAARKAAVEKWMESNGDKMDITASLTQSAEANAKDVQQALQKGNLKEVLSRAKRIDGAGVNPDTFMNDTARAFVHDMETPVEEFVKDNHVHLIDFRYDALERIVKAGGDTVFDMDAMKAQLADADSRQRVATLHMFLDTTFGQQWEIAAQNLKEGAEGSMDTLRNLYTRGLEALTLLKKDNMIAAQTLNMNRLSKISGAVKKTAQNVDTPFKDALAFAKESAATMTDDELREFSVTLREAVANGGEDVGKVMLASLNKDNQLRKLVKDGSNPIYDAVLKYRYIAMLSSVKTQMRNVLGNSMKQAIMPIEETVQGMVRGGIEGFKDGGLAGMGVGALKGSREGLYYLQGMHYAFKHAWQHMGLAWEYGQSFARSGEYSNLGKNVAKDTSIVRNIYESPLRALNAMDEFFATLSGGAKIYQKSMLDLKNSHVLDDITDNILKKDLASKWMDDAFTKGFTPIKTVDGTLIEHGALKYKEALAAADEATFQQGLEGFTKSFAGFVQKHPALKVIFPFVKTPANLFKDVFWTRGLDAPMELAKSMMSGDPERVAKAASHLVSAIGIWGMAYSLVADGKVTGNGPTDKDNRAALMANGWQPNSFIMPDGSYVKLASVEPFGSAIEVLATIVEMGERGGVEDSVEWLDVAWDSLLKFTMDRTYLKGLSSLLSSIDKGKTNDANGIATQTLLSFIPNAFSDIGKSMDDTIYESKSLVEKIQNKLGITETLSPRVSWLSGQPLLYGHGGGLGAFSPLNKTEDRGNLVFSEMSRVDGISEPSHKVGNIDLSNAEYAELCRLNGTVKLGGKTLYDSLYELFTNEWYDEGRLKNPDPSDYELADHRNKAIQEIVRRYRKEAQKQFLTARPYIKNPDPNYKAGEMMDNFDAITQF